MSILNSSIGIPGIEGNDFANYTDKQLKNWNEFESIAEWVAEEVMDIKDAVPEIRHKSGNEHSIIKKHSPVYVLIRLQKPKVRHSSVSCSSLPVLQQENQKPLAGFITLFSPPPDAV